MDKGGQPFKKILVPVFSISDSFIMIYAQKLMQNSQAFLSVVDVSGAIHQNPEFQSTIAAVGQTSPGLFSLFADATITQHVLNDHDLLLISYEHWKWAVESEEEWLSFIPSVLIIKP